MPMIPADYAPQKAVKAVPGAATIVLHQGADQQVRRFGKFSTHLLAYLKLPQGSLHPQDKLSNLPFWTVQKNLEKAA